MKSRIIAIAMSVITVISILPLTVFAETYKGNYGNSHTWEFDPDTGTLTISGKGDMPDYYQKPKNDPYDLNGFLPAMKKLIITDGVTGIGDSAFIACKSLEEAELPDTLKSISQFAFSGCSKLSDITFSANLESIGSYAFNNCVSLNNISLPDSLKRIGSNVFEGCTSLTGINIPGGVEIIGISAFEDCTSLKSVTFNEGLKEIRKWAFYNCSSLTKTELPESIERIGEDSFMKCTLLSEISIPEKAIEIGPSAFTLTKWYGDRPNGFVLLGKTLYAYKGNIPLNTEIEIPDGTKAVADQCFMFQSGIDKVIIPASVEFVGNRIFFGCNNLTEITVDEENAYYSSVEGVLYNKDITAIIRLPEGKNAVRFDIPDSVNKVCETAFRGCETLETVSILKSVTAIENNAFLRCRSLARIYYEGSEADWADISIGDGNVSLLNAKVYYNGETEPEPAFTDVPDNAWFEAAALWCSERGFITGTGEGTFSPDMQLTRAMFVQILAKVAGVKLDDITYGGKFTDVKPGDWFAKAVQWAVDNKITGGTSETTFSPNAPVTREQLAVFFYAYSKSTGYNVSAQADLGDYSDAGQISSWAVTAIKWAVAEGLISGTSKTTISPKGNATRAQAAVIFKNFIEK